MLIKKMNKGGKDRVICLDGDGNIQHFQAAWTNYQDGDSCGVATEAGFPICGDFRFEDLNMLAKLLCDLGGV